MVEISARQVTTDSTDGEKCVVTIVLTRVSTSCTYLIRRLTFITGIRGL